MCLKLTDSVSEGSYKMTSPEISPRSVVFKRSHQNMAVIVDRCMLQITITVAPEIPSDCITKRTVFHSISYIWPQTKCMEPVFSVCVMYIVCVCVFMFGSSALQKEML